MIIAVSALDGGLEAPFHRSFGRSPVFVVIDTETMNHRSLANPGAAAGGGAGIRAAQTILDEKVEALISGDVGPNAYAVLQAAHLPVYIFSGGTVRQAVEAFRSGRLSRADQATGPARGGIGGGMGTGVGRGRGRRGRS